MSDKKQSISGFRMSVQQKHVWTQPLLRPTATHFPGCHFVIKETFNAENLKKSLTQIVARHEIFRTQLYKSPEMDIPIQTVSDTASFQLKIDSSRNQNKQSVISQFAGESATAYAKQTEPILYCLALENSDDSFELFICAPPTHCDSKTLVNIAAEIGLLLKSNFTEKLPDPIQYIDASEWQFEVFESDKAAQNFWHERKQERVEPAALSFDPIEKSIAEIDYCKHTLILSDSELKTLSDFAKIQSVTAEHVFLSAWQVTLWHHQRNEMARAEVYFDGRNNEELRAVIGPLGKYIPVSCFVTGQTQMSSVLTEIKQALTQISDKQTHFDPEQFALRKPNQGYAFRYNEINTQEAEILSADFFSGKFNIELEVFLKSQNGALNFQYNRNMIDQVMLESFAEHYHKVLLALIKNPSIKVDEIQILDAKDVHFLTQKLNDATVNIGEKKCLHQMFEEQAKLNPKGPALLWENESLSYAELNRKADQMSQFLKSKGVKKGDSVAIYLERSFEMIISILGTLKLGCAYIPIDTQYPKNRISVMLEDTLPTAIISTSDLFSGEIQRPATSQLVNLDHARQQILAGSSESLNTKIDSDQAAYILFTSGSTGKPKGVVVKHDSLQNFFYWMNNRFPLEKNQKVLQICSLSFDVSVREIFWALTSGAQLVLAKPHAQQNNVDIIEAIVRYEISQIRFAPSMLNVFLEEEQVSSCVSLSRVFCGGEAMSVELMNRFFAKFPGVELHNMYGPTETTINASSWACSKQSQNTSVPIGKPIANAKVYILNTMGNPVPYGAPGEMYIGGSGVAGGYFNRPELTLEKFVADPFSSQKNAVMYRTGDIGRFLPNGDIQFFGRIDSQVKIRGFRIELGEIEHALRQHDVIQDALVLVRSTKNDDKNLVAYVQVRSGDVTKDGPTPNQEKTYQRSTIRIPGRGTGEVIGADFIASQFTIETVTAFGVALVGDVEKLKSGQTVHLKLKFAGFNDDFQVGATCRWAKNGKAGFQLAGQELEMKKVLSYVEFRINELGLSAEKMREFLSKSLPDYMMPAQFVLLNFFPLTVNGKIDTKALPEPKASSSSQTFVAPRNDLEINLCRVWQKVLTIEKIGVHDNYFSLGGDSIRTIQIAQGISKFGFPINPIDILKYPTISSLAVHIQGVSQVESNDKPNLKLVELSPSIMSSLPADVSDAYPTTQMQDLMIEQYVADENRLGIYHVQQTMVLNDPEGFSILALEKAINNQIKKHPAFRTGFKLMPDGSYLQMVRKSLLLKIETFEIQNLTPSQQSDFIDNIFVEDRKHPFQTKVFADPLIRMKVFIKSKTQIELMRSVHHAISDGWGKAQFFGDIAIDYLAQKKGQFAEENSQSEVNTYKEFVALEKEILQSKETRRFWKDHLQQAKYVPLTKAQKPLSGSSKLPIAEMLDKQISDPLNLLAKQLSVPPKAIFLSCFLDTIAQFQANKSVTVGVVSNGRSSRLTNALKAVGLFWNVVPFHLSVQDQDKVKQAKRVHDTLVEFENYARYPLKQNLLDQGVAQLFDCSFNFVHFHNVLENQNAALDWNLTNRLHDKFHYPLNFLVAVDPLTSEIHIRVEYDHKLFSELEMKNLVSFYKKSVESFLGLSFTSKAAA